MKRRKNIITVAIDAPAAAGAGTLAKKPNKKKVSSESKLNEEKKTSSK